MLMLLLAVGCRRNDAPSTSTSDGSVARLHAMEASAPVTAIESARRVVMAWSDALSRHDVASLESIYAEQVHYYGRPLAKGALLRAKEDALGQAKTFRQEIVGPIVIREEGGGIVASFTKRSGGRENSTT
jgi:hypothetical protein